VDWVLLREQVMLEAHDARVSPVLARLRRSGSLTARQTFYEFQTTLQTPEIHAGRTFDLDCSLTRVLPPDKDRHPVQVASPATGNTRPPTRPVRT
jgi:hypothetical protein